MYKIIHGVNTTSNIHESSIRSSAQEVKFKSFTLVNFDISAVLLIIVHDLSCISLGYYLDECQSG